MNKDDNTILLFDGACNLCNGFVKWILHWDKKKKIKLAPLQSLAGQSLLTAYHLSATRFESLIYIRKNTVFQHSTAVLYVSKDLGKYWNLLFFAIFIPRFIRDFFYKLIAKNRYKIFGNSSSCPLPTGENLERFLK